MTSGLKTVIYPVADLARAKVLYSVLLGVEPYVEDAFARGAGFDPRTLDEEYVYLRIRPERIQAWRDENELAGRDLMRGGVWLV
jgi:hypothetical protein